MIPTAYSRSVQPLQLSEDPILAQASLGNYPSHRIIEYDRSLLCAVTSEPQAFIVRQFVHASRVWGRAFR